MAGLGLQNALRGYQQGVQWRQTQDEIQRQQQHRQSIEQANQAATSVIDQSKAEWALNGAQGQYKPSDDTMFKAAEARGQALAKAGLWDQFVQNEAQVAPMRLRARSNALQQYELDGDVDRLARTVYPTLFDGKQIVGSERVEGAPAVGQFAARPGKLKLKLSDGTEHSLEPDKLVGMIKMSLLDPVQTAKREAELNAARLKAEFEADSKIRVEGVKGEQARQTEGVRSQYALRLEDRKAENQRGLADVKFGHELQVAGVNNEAAQRRTQTSANASLGAAKISADARVQAAKIGKAGEGSGKSGGLAAAQKWSNLAKDHFGKIAGGPTGSSRMAGQATLDLASTAQRIFEANKGKLTETQALNEAAKFLKLESPKEGQDD